MIDFLEIIHNSGLVFNDLKPDNIVLTSPNDLNFVNSYQNLTANDKNIINFYEFSENVQFSLVDFGLCSRWMSEETGSHLQRKRIAYFVGNLYYSSVNQLQSMTSSRRDDLHSLAYLLANLLNHN